MGRKGHSVPPLTALDTVVAAFAAYRLTRLVVLDDLPPVAKARSAFIKAAGPGSAWSEMISCPWCSGYWVSAVVALAVSRWPLARKLALVPAFSAAAGLLSTLDSYLGAEPDLSEPREFVRVLP
jgi:hypothetical protein